MKLSIKHKIQIVGLAVKRKQEALNKLKEKIEKFDAQKDVLDAIGTASERKKMDALPEGWLRTENYFYIDEPNIQLTYSKIGMNSQISKEELSQPRIPRVDFSDSVRIKAGMSKYHIPCSDRIIKMFEDYEAKFKELQTLRVDIFNNLRTFKTTEELEKDWPAMRRYTKQLVNQEQVVALLVPIKSINERLGIQEVEQ